MKNNPQKEALAPRASFRITQKQSYWAETQPETRSQLVRLAMDLLMAQRANESAEVRHESK